MGATPFSHLTTWLPEAVGRSFSRQELSQSPLILLLERARVRVAAAEQVIGAENATDSVATALGLEPGTALLKMVRTLRDEDGRAVEHTKVLYNPSLYQYSMLLERMLPEAGVGWRHAEKICRFVGSVPPPMICRRVPGQSDD